jgi:transcriptional regulator with GAF, ATPase, and Fis domain
LTISCEFTIFYNFARFDMAAPSFSLYILPSSKFEELQEAMLRIWQAGISERSLLGVLVAIAEVLRPLLPFSSLSLVRFEQGQARVYGLNITSTEPSGESRLVHSLECTNRPPFQRQRLTYNFLEMQRRLHSGKPFTCPNLLAKASWYEHEFHLAAAGIRAYASLPLLSAAKVVGCAIFGRLEPCAFTAHELGLLRDLSSAMAGVVANALANERMTDRCMQVENENTKLHSQVSQMEVAARDSGLSRACSPDLEILHDGIDDEGVGELQPVTQSTDISARLKEEERRLIEATLQTTRGRISGPNGAAVRLGLPSSTLEFRIRRLGIDKFQYRRGCQEQL